MDNNAEWLNVTFSVPAGTPFKSIWIYVLPFAKQLPYSFYAID